MPDWKRTTRAGELKPQDAKALQLQVAWKHGGLVQIKSTVLEIVHEIPEVTKLLVGEENERSQVEEINQEEKVSFFLIYKSRQEAR